jgi:hypothetical protein
LYAEAIAEADSPLISAATFSYALAKATGLPLLFKGKDFSKTDLLAALANT